MLTLAVIIFMVRSSIMISKYESELNGFKEIAHRIRPSYKYKINGKYTLQKNVHTSLIHNSVGRAGMTQTSQKSIFCPQSGLRTTNDRNTINT